MHELYKSNDVSCKNTFGVKKVYPSKAESYLELNAWTEWQQQDLISEYGQGLAYWTRRYYTGHIIPNFVFEV